MTAFHRSSRWMTFSRQARPIVQASLPRPCGKCGLPVMPTDQWDLGHIIDHATNPFQPLSLAMVRPEHRGCNRTAGAKLGRRRQLERKAQNKKLPGADSPWKRGKNS